MEKTRKTEILRYDYPLNLLKAIEDVKSHFEFVVDTVTEDQIVGLEYALSQLTERERQILSMRYQERKTLKQIGEEIGVTGERIRSQEHRGIYRLRKPPLLGYIKYGKAAYEKLIAEKKAEKEKEYNERGFNIPLEELDFTVRAFNNLKKIGCDTVADIVDLSEEKILSVNSLGVKTRIEIAQKLETLGAYNTAWSIFLPKEKK